MKIKKLVIRHWSLVILVILSWFAVKEIFAPGFFPIHDQTQVERVEQMAQALKDGQFPVRWVGDLGYGFGYPIFNFYAPLAYYVGAFFNLIGFDVLLATKLMMTVGVVLAGVSMYFLAKEFWGPPAGGLSGLAAGLFYVYAPYHAVDIYVRGAVGEFWAMAFLPLVFLGLYRLYRGRYSGVLVAGLSFAAVILCHNLTALMLIPFIFLTGIILLAASKNKKLFTIYFLLSTFFAFGISAFYWLPAIVEMKYTKVFGQIGGGADFRDHFVFPDQLWVSTWGFGGSAPSREDGMSFIIGHWHLLAVFLALVISLWLYRHRQRQKTLVILVAFAFFFVATFLTTQYSYFIWQSIPIMAFLQYPWRFLALAVFFASFMAGVIVWVFKKEKNWFQILVTFGLITVLLLINSKYFKPKTNFPITSADYQEEKHLKWVTSQISDEYLPKDFPIPKEKSEVAWEKIKILSGEAEINDLQVKSHLLRFIVVAQTDSQILVNTAYFPGWKVWIDSQPTEPEIEAGKIRLTLNPGSNKVLLKFTNIPIRTLANLVSLISFLLIPYILKIAKDEK